MNDNLRQLKELASSLPPLPVIHSEGKMVVKTKTGEMEVAAVFEADDANISIATMTGGAECPPHMHNETVWLINFTPNSELHISSNGFDDIARLEEKGGFFVLRYGDSIMIPPRTKHRLRAITDLQVISVSVPRSKDFPTCKLMDGPDSKTS